MADAEFSLTGLTGREYKMMLRPAKFAGLPDKAGARFWRNHLGPIVAKHIEGDGDGDGEFEDLFGETVRSVMFHDTDALLLDKHGYSLRVRHDEEAATSEVTLKLRTPDIFQSGTASLAPSAKIRGDEISLKFEEDIAPLEVQTKGKGVAFPAEPSIRSRFSRSTKRKRRQRYEIATFEDATKLFSTLDPNLKANGAGIASTAALNSGPSIREHAFKTKADVALKDGIEVGFALTLWYFNRKRPPGAKTLPKVAEVSFQWESGKQKKITGEQARRALNLFLAMQENLSGWIDPDNASKTKLGLPERKPVRARGARRKKP